MLYKQSSTQRGFITQSTAIMDTRFQHPYTAVLAGPTGSVKTEFIKDFLKNINHLVTPIPTMVLFCYAEWQPAYDEMKTYGLNLKFVEGISDLDNLTQGPPKLVIIDDLMAEADEQITRLFTKGSHHKNISVMHIVQNLFSKNKEQRCINLNSHYMVLFKNPRDSSQIIHLATAKPWSYLLVDLKQNTPDHLRLRGEIFQGGGRQTVYVPRK